MRRGQDANDGAVHLRQYSYETEGGNFQHATCNSTSLFIYVCVDPKVSTCQ